MSGFEDLNAREVEQEKNNFENEEFSGKKKESETNSLVELSEKEQVLKENDYYKIERTRAQIEGYYKDNDVRKLKEIPEKMSQREKVERVKEAGSFDEKFKLLKELQEGGYKFEIKGLINNILQTTVDFSSAKEKREDFVTDIEKAIEAAFKDGRLPDNFFEGIKCMISAGSGHGENPCGILKKYMPEYSRAILIDPYAAPSKTIVENRNIQHLGQKFEDVKIEISEGDKNLIEASNFLQLYDEEGKIEMVKKMIELAGIGGKIIIVDEINREKWTERAQDRILNKIYNPVQKTYERMDFEDYKGMFENLGLRCFTLDRYNRGSALFMLEVTTEAMAVARESDFYSVDVE